MKCVPLSAQCFLHSELLLCTMCANMCVEKWLWMHCYDTCDGDDVVNIEKRGLCQNNVPVVWKSWGDFQCLSRYYSIALCWKSYCNFCPFFSLVYLLVRLVIVHFDCKDVCFDWACRKLRNSAYTNWSNIVPQVHVFSGFVWCEVEVVKHTWLACSHYM